MHSHTKVWQMQELTVKNLKRIKQERVAVGGGGQSSQGKHQLPPKATLCFRLLTNIKKLPKT